MHVGLYYCLSYIIIVKAHIFSNRIVDHWNSLPEYVINAESTNSFKNRLDNYWKMTGYGYLQRPLA